jgi:hypothetical protein
VLICIANAPGVLQQHGNVLQYYLCVVTLYMMLVYRLSCCTQLAPGITSSSVALMITYCCDCQCTRKVDMSMYVDNVCMLSSCEHACLHNYSTSLHCTYMLCITIQNMIQCVVQRSCFWCLIGAKASKCLLDGTAACTAYMHDSGTAVLCMSAFACIIV